MKKRTLLISFVLAVSLLACFALAAGGDAGDPLNSLNFLNGAFTKTAEEKLDAAVDQAAQDALGSAKAEWTSAVARAEASAGSDYAAKWTEASLKQGDILSGTMGLQVIPYTGGITVRFSSGAVIDVTDGRELASGEALTSGHRYLTAEDTTALFTVSGKTAVVSYCGSYHFTLSGQPDYNAMAAALRLLSLFRGTDTPYGGGNDLDRVPTRSQAIIMLIRMLGEEDAALTCTAKHPFVDVPDWCAPYVAYAYEKGYSNGVGRDRYGRELFGSDMDASAIMYTEFMLRALGYSSTDVSDISDALERAQSAGVLTAGETAFLKNTDFLRADVVYLSYYALSARMNDGTELSRRLSGAGVFSAAEYRTAQALVTTDRIS